MQQYLGGRLIVVSSVSGLFGLPNLAGYCMSKSALHGFFEALRNEGTGALFELLKIYLSTYIYESLICAWCGFCVVYMDY